MKTVYWDTAEVWDDPNIYWGDPSYKLEPGDPGYVPPFPQNPEPKTKRKRMRRNTYFPMRQADQIVWLVNFSNKLPGHATVLGVTNAQRDSAVADCKWLVYVLQSWLSGVRTWALACSDAATEAQDGPGTGLMALPVFTAPALPAGVVPVNTGALDRIFALVQLLKDGGLATETVRTDLGIIGTEMIGPDLNAIQPVIDALIAANQVKIKWGWDGHGAFLDLIEIQVDRGTGAGFVVLTYDTTPNYNDTQPFPATPAIWTYRAIYRVEDHQVGVWSNPVTVTVPG